MADYVQASGSPDVYLKAGNGVLTKASGTVDPNNIQQVDSLNNAYANDIATQVNGQVDPQLQATTDSLSAQGSADTTANKSLVDSLNTLFAQRQQSDPFGRAGITSSQANAVETGNEATSLTNANQDLQSKLSAIAQQLTDAKTGAASQKASLTNSLKNQYLNNNTTYQNNLLTAQQAADKVTPVDLGDRIALMRPDGSIAGYQAKGVNPTTTSSSDALIQALAGILGGNGTGTGTGTTGSGGAGNGLAPEFQDGYTPPTLSVGQGSTSTGLQGGSPSLQGGSTLQSDQVIQQLQKLLQGSSNSPLTVKR